MERRTLLGLFIGGMWCVLDSFAQLAYAAVEINVAPLSNGTFGKVIGVTDISPSGTATAVVQAKDKFGNIVNRTKTLTVNATKYGTWARTAMGRVPAVQIAIGTAAAVAGYLVVKTVDDFGVVTYDIYKPGGALPGLDVACPTSTSTVPNPSGIGNVQAYIPTPCYKTNVSNQRQYWATSPSTDLQEWAGNAPNVVTRWNSTSVSVPPNQNPTYIYTRGINSQMPDIKPTAKKIPATDTDLSTWGFQSPDGLQESPGKFPDVWNPVPWEDTATDDEIINPPTTPGEGTDDPDYDPCQGDCADVSDLETSVLDLSSFLKWGDGWMPRQCPAPVLVYQFNNTPDGQGWFDYSYICSVMTDFVSPFMRIAGLFFFVRIVVGGLRE